MKIAIIGAGNVGGALAKQWAKAGHIILLGLRNLNSSDAKAREKFSSNISSHTIEEAIKNSEVVLFSTPPEAAVAIAKQNPVLKNKIVIDATNAVFKNPSRIKQHLKELKKKPDAKI